MISRLGGHFIITAVMIAFACSVGISPGFAQQQGRDRGTSGQQPQDPATLRIDTELVQIDVVVTDKQGKLVSGLKREDFQLFEDGKPQTISHFSVGTATRQAEWLRPKSTADSGKEARPVPAAPAINAGRYLVLAIDDVHLAPGNLMLAKQALNKFIDQQLGIGDQVALVTTSGQVGMFQQFTADREVLQRGVNRLSVAERATTSPMDVPRITPYQAELIDRNDPDALELAVQELLRQGMDRRMATRDAQTRARMIIQYSNSLALATLSTIENIVRDLRNLPGRKIVVLLSDGFMIGSSGNGVHYDIRRITDAATRAGVVVYSIDARGLVAMPSTMDASQPGFNATGALAGARFRIENGSIEAQRDGLFALAEDTGGKAFFNNNDMNMGLQRVLNDTESYYLLAFEPAVSFRKGRDGRFRKLEVKLPSRPDLKVRTRKGYFSPDDKAAEKAAREKAKAAEKDKQRLSEKSDERLAAEARSAKEKQIREGVSSLFNRREVPVEMAINFLSTRRDGSQAEVTAHIEATTIKFEQVNDRHRATLEIIGFVFNEGGKSELTFSDSLVMNFKPETLERTLKSGITYHKQVKLKPGFYQLRLVARDEGGAQLGTASSWFEIPDLSQKRLTLSSILFANTGEELKPAPGAQKPGQMTGNPAGAGRPMHVYRRFKRNGNFDFMVFAYNAKSDSKGTTDLAIQSQIYSGNKLLLATPLKGFPTDAASPAPDGKQQPVSVNPQDGVPYLARLSLDGFAPGEYELRLVVVDRSAKTSAKRSINFAIE